MEHKLFDMLAIRRPAGSKSERQWIARFIDSVDADVDFDDYGNRYVHIPKGDGTPSSVAFTAHTDTVHWKGGEQKIAFDGVNLFTYDEDSNCLGADDGVGVYLLLEMIDKRIPGHYCFFRDEESGGRGSAYLADMFKDNDPEASWLHDVTKMVSMDRKGFNSVITHQAYGRCCSDEFAIALAEQLDFEIDDSGVFTDSAQFADVVDECTNLSVGYYSEHTKDEYVDMQFVQQILPKLLKVEWEELPVVAFPYGYVDDYDYSDSFGGYNTRGYDYDVELTAQEQLLALSILKDDYPDIYDEILDEVIYQVEPQRIRSVS